MRDKIKLYAVTDRKWARDTDAFFAQIEAAIRGGAGVVQLREKGMDRAAFLEEAKRFVALCRELGAVSIINDDVETAKLSGADGVHLGQEDTAVRDARETLGTGKIIGASAHNVHEAIEAELNGADYLGSGAVFGTDTKGNVTPLPRRTLIDITRSVSIPVVAIGGVTKENIGLLAGCGISGVAVVSALFGADDTRAAAAELRRLVDLIVK